MSGVSAFALVVSEEGPNDGQMPCTIAEYPESHDAFPCTNSTSRNNENQLFDMLHDLNEATANKGKYADDGKYDRGHHDMVHGQSKCKYMYKCPIKVHPSGVNADEQQQQPSRGCAPETSRKRSKNFTNRNIATEDPLSTKDEFDLTPNDLIRRPNDLGHLQYIIAYNGKTLNRLTVVWFYRLSQLASRQIYAQVQKCAKLYRYMADLMEVEASDHTEIMRHYHVTDTPTFLFFLGGEECKGERIHGDSHIKDLHEKIKRLFRLSKEADKSVDATYVKDTKKKVETKEPSQSQSKYQPQSRYQSQGKYQDQVQNQKKYNEKKQSYDNSENDEISISYQPQNIAELVLERYGDDLDSWDMEAPFNSTRPSLLEMSHQSGGDPSQSMPQSHNPKVSKACEHFVRGKCSYGYSCIYQHLTGEEAEAYLAARPWLKRKKVCQYFPIGRCFYGEKCWYIHDPNVKIYCKYFAIGKCFYGDKCWYLHEVRD